jgi:hypothetical protein
VSTLVAAGGRYALDAATRIAGTDGRISASEMAALGTLQADLGFLRGPELRYSESVARDVLADHGLTDLSALLAKAGELDNGNGYLARNELEAAAKLLVGPGAEEIGVVSDLDSTVIPPDVNGAMVAPYPGIATLLRELEFGRGGQAGDVRYVTARSPDRIGDIPDYLMDHQIPEGPIDTGIGTMPWVAEKEKVADIARIFEAHPEQKFVLFGDTKHRDPEVYKEIQRLYPNQVTAVFINKVNVTVNPARVEGMNMIENYAQAAGSLLESGVLDEAAARRVMVAAQSEGLAITDAQIDALIAANR